MSNEQPLIFVVYLDRSILVDGESINLISGAMKDALNEKGVNNVLFFVPTDGQERIECINPVIASDEQMQKIDNIINHLENSFDIKHDLTQDD